VESAGIRIQRKRSGPGRWNHDPWSGSGGAYKAQACCPRLEGLVPGSETEVSTNLWTP